MLCKCEKMIFHIYIAYHFHKDYVRRALVFDNLESLFPSLHQGRLEGKNIILAGGKDGKISIWEIY